MYLHVKSVFLFYAFVCTCFCHVELCLLRTSVWACAWVFVFMYVMCVYICYAYVFMYVMCVYVYFVFVCVCVVCLRPSCMLCFLRVCVYLRLRTLCVQRVQRCTVTIYLHTGDVK